MRLILGLAGLAAATAAGTMAPAFAGDMQFACAREQTVRTVSVVDNPGSGHACEVQYAKTSDGEGPQTLWHADNSKTFCVKQAEALVQRLTEAGWSCDAKGSTLAEAAAPAETAEPKAAEAAKPKVTQAKAEVAPAKPAQTAAQIQATKMPEPFAVPVPVSTPDPQGISAAVREEMPIDAGPSETGGERAPIDPDNDPAAAHAPPGHSAGSFSLRPTLH